VNSYRDKLNTNNLNLVRHKELIQGLFKTTLLKNKTTKISKLSEAQLEQIKDLLNRE